MNLMIVFVIFSEFGNGVFKNAEAYTMMLTLGTVFFCYVNASEKHVQLLSPLAWLDVSSPYGAAFKSGIFKTMAFNTKMLQ